jgi:hypothetical protein
MFILIELLSPERVPIESKFGKSVLHQNSTSRENVFKLKKSLDRWGTTFLSTKSML